MEFLDNVLDSANIKCIKKHSMSIYSYCGLNDEHTELIKRILIDPIVSSAFNQGAMNLVSQLRMLTQHLLSISGGIESEVEKSIRDVYYIKLVVRLKHILKSTIMWMKRQTIYSESWGYYKY